MTFTAIIQSKQLIFNQSCEVHVSINQQTFSTGFSQALKLFSPETVHKQTIFGTTALNDSLKISLKN